MKVITKILIVSMLICNVSYAQNFTKLSTNLNDYWYPSSDWADMDNDGDLDLVISGAIDTNASEFADTSSIDLYENVNGTLTRIEQPNLYGLHLGSVKFIDIDNDGDQDLVTCGQNYNNITNYFLTVYENNDGIYSVIQQLDGVIYSSMDLGDYDNDGDLDLLITGVGSNGLITTIYNNTNGTFSDASANLPGVQNGNAVFADIDTDGDLDVIINGYDTNYDNFGGLYTNENGLFSLGSLPFTSANSWIVMGDYDNDGDLDLAYTGYNDDYDNVTKIYNNNGVGTFTDSGIALEGVSNGSGNNPIVWGDYDNDGDLDLVFAGTDNNYDDKVYLYVNNGAAFNLASEGLLNLGSYANLSFSDFDADADLDFLISGGSDAENYVGRTHFYENTIAMSNAKPNAPNNLVSQINQDNSITFTWGSATDDLTPSEGLYYFLTVGTTENGSEIASYKVQGNSWTLKNLGSTNYYWTLSAVDTCFMLSDKATNNTLSIENVSRSDIFNIYPNPSTDKQITLVYDVNTLSSENNDVSIYSITGQKVFQTTLSSNQGFRNKSIDLSSLSNGIYMLQFTSGEFTTNKKIILK